MNSKIESIDDLLLPNFEASAKDLFKQFSVIKEGFLNHEEFQAFLKFFFNDEISLYPDLLNSEFYNTSNKSRCSDGINYNDFTEVYKDCYIMKNHGEVENNNEGLDIKFETDDLF